MKKEKDIGHFACRECGYINEINLIDYESHWTWNCQYCNEEHIALLNWLSKMGPKRKNYTKYFDNRFN
jgi:hypothetical protein